MQRIIKTTAQMMEEFDEVIRQSFPNEAIAIFGIEYDPSWVLKKVDIDHYKEALWNYIWSSGYEESGDDFVMTVETEEEIFDE